MPPKTSNEIRLSGGPYNGGFWYTTSTSGSFVFTAKGMTGRYDRHGIWRKK